MRPVAIHARPEIGPSANATDLARRGDPILCAGVAAVDGRVVDLILILWQLGIAGNRNFFRKGKKTAGQF